MSTTVLVVLDGFGYRASPEFNAIKAATAPTLALLAESAPMALLQASGTHVGLPEGQMGNSEVGHMTLGAGRCFEQELTTLNTLVAKGKLEANPRICALFEGLKARSGALHLLGLLSDGGVHAHLDHILAVAKAAAKRGITVYLHAFLDGRDTPPKQALRFLERCTQATNYLKIASLIGRYYAMDRDKRWDRIEEAYRLIVSGKGRFEYITPHAALAAAYERGETDEFVKSSWILGNPSPTKEDAFFFMNFRADRARQLSTALIEPNFSEFPRCQKAATPLYTLTTYAPNLPAQVIFPKPVISNSIGEWLAKKGKRQFRISETEKFAHVTFFFNGGRHEPFTNEFRALIPSPAVPTYDLQPEMSSALVTDALIDAIETGTYDFILCNYPNADMVGHTGSFVSAVRAIEALDLSLTKLLAAVKKAHGQMLITADHGNAEIMFDPVTQQPHTAHTCSTVPCFYVGTRAVQFKKEGELANVAPTILELMDLPIPPEMTSASLIEANPQVA